MREHLDAGLCNAGDEGRHCVQVCELGLPEGGRLQHQAYDEEGEEVADDQAAYDERRCQGHHPAWFLALGYG